MNKGLIVTIFVPTGQGKEGKIGTGYPVAEDLILTSCHVINPEQSDQKYPIQIRWHHYADRDAPDKGWITLSSDDIAWEGEGEMDAALLRCPRPERAQGKGWGMIADKKPPFDKSWQSQGFPAATRYENVRNPDDISGTTESMADQADYFVLNVTSQPEEVEMWKGASGMPVFVHNEILGVVRSVPGNFSGKKLYAVPTWKMLEDAAFQKILGLDKRHEYLAAISKTLTRILRTSGMEVKGDTPCPTHLLAEQLALDWCGDKENCLEIAQGLLGLHVEQFFNTVKAVRKKMRAEDNLAGISVCAHIVHHVLPVLFNPKIVEDLRRCKDDETVALQTLPTELPTVAEVIMAGVDRRAASYRPRKPGLDWPEGEASLPQPPEAGRDKHGKQLAEDLRSQLADWLMPNVTEASLEKEFDAYMRWRFIGDDMRKLVMSKEGDAIDQYIAQELEYQTENEDDNDRRTYYLLVPWILGCYPKETPKGGGGQPAACTVGIQLLPPADYLRPRALWWAFAWDDATERAEKAGIGKPDHPKGWQPTDGCVVLIDEIDKAESDVPNGLLEALGAHSFHPQGLGRPIIASSTPPLVIITTNEERALPDAFVRRCLVLHLQLPKESTRLKEHLISRGKAHFEGMTSENVLKTAADCLTDDRQKAAERHWHPLPGQAEYLDLLRAVIGQRPDDHSAQEALLAEIKRFVFRKHPDAATEDIAADEAAANTEAAP